VVRGPQFEKRLCRRLRHNKMTVKVKVYSVGYVIVIHNATRPTKYQIYPVVLLLQTAMHCNVCLVRNFACDVFSIDDNALCYCQ
jgi:hypothetical protein